MSESLVIPSEIPAENNIKKIVTQVKKYQTSELILRKQGCYIFVGQTQFSAKNDQNFDIFKRLQNHFRNLVVFEHFLVEKIILSENLFLPRIHDFMADF